VTVVSWDIGCCGLGAFLVYHFINPEGMSVKNLFSSLFGQFFLKKEESSSDKQTEADEFSELLMVHGNAIVRLENIVESLVGYVGQLERTVGSAGKFSSNNLNSLYIDRFPQTADDFLDWEKHNWHDVYGYLKDKEFHRLFELAMCQIASSLSPDSDGDYLEFGCCGAGSFLNALSKARKWRLFNMNFFAFDSFEGLPTDGTLAFSEKDFWKLVNEQGIFTDKVTAIKGFYDKSLTPELQKTFVDKKRKAVFVNIDCDLHESAIPVFKFISPLIAPGTIVNLDDFYSTFQHGFRFGTALAFFDFANNHPSLGFYPFYRSGHGSMAYIAYDKNDFKGLNLI
jgi:hypothetical protein